MKHKLSKIKEESQELCSSISADLRKQEKVLEQSGLYYKNLDEFDRDFFGDPGPLSL